MQAPLGVVPALCTTAVGFLATGSAILAYLIQFDIETLKSTEIFAILAMVLGLFFIGIVPWLISKPVSNDMGVNLQPARKSLAIGTIIFFVAIFVFFIQ